MTPTYDFDRLLESVLETGGPQTLPGTLVATALAEARAVRQRRPIVRSLDRRAWPAARPSVADSTMRRYATVGLLILLILTLVAVAGLVGSRLLARPFSGPLGPIAYIQGGDVYLADRDGGHSVLLLDDPGVDFSAVTWLADGRSLAVEGGGVMNVVDTTSRALRRIGRLGDWGTMWSPARDAYAYAAGQPTTITIADVASGRTRDVHPDDVSADSGYVGSLAWTADERWFAASALKNNALVVVDAASGATTEVTRFESVDTNCRRSRISPGRRTARTSPTTRSSTTVINPCSSWTGTGARRSSSGRSRWCSLTRATLVVSSCRRGLRTVSGSPSRWTRASI